MRMFARHILLPATMVGCCFAPAGMAFGAQWQELEIVVQGREGEKQEAFEKLVGEHDITGMQDILYQDLIAGLDLSDWKKQFVREDVDHYVDRVVQWRDAHVDGMRKVLLELRAAMNQGDAEQTARLREKLESVFGSRPYFQILVENVRDQLTQAQEYQYGRNLLRIRSQIDAFTGGMSELDENVSERASLLEARMQARLLKGIPLRNGAFEPIRQAIDDWSDEQASWWGEHKYELASLRMSIKHARRMGDDVGLESLRQEWLQMRDSMPNRDAMYEAVRSHLNAAQQNQFDKNVRQMQGQHQGLRERMLS